MLVKTIKEFDLEVEKLNPNCLGFVPTMGALHEGHLSLIQKAKEQCDSVVVSIFVNPTQFDNPKDLEKYPRTLDEDVDAIQTISSDIIVYAPNVQEIYPDDNYSEIFDFGELAVHMEGKYRKGHFDGVGTVLKKLFALIKPHKAYFGKKDYQQLAVVQKLVKLTGQHVEIVGCETHRENNGLAKSSRNKLLTDEQKQKAGIIYEQLNLIKNFFERKSIGQLKKIVKANFEATDMFSLEYLEIASTDDLIPTEDIQPQKKYRAFIAVFCNDVRLIDNLALN